MVRRNLLSAEPRAYVWIVAGVFLQHQCRWNYVHFYESSELDWRLENGIGLKVTQKTRYPWEGDLEMTVAPAEDTEFTFYVRFPAGRAAELSVNGKAVAGVTSGEYVPIRRRSKKGDVIRLSLEVVPQMIAANPRVADDSGRVALQRLSLNLLHGRDRSACWCVLDRCRG